MRERDIFDAALAIADPIERDAFLASACEGDTELQEHLRGLIEAERGLGSFLESPAAAPTLMEPHPGSEGPGTVIGSYKLLEVIGEGGMGTVYMAEQSQPVRRKVALKVIKPGMDTKQVVARFEAERQALAMMDHPNIARVFDGGATPSGRPYFVMELVPGIPITEYCDREQLPIAERLELFVLVCRAVQHAHLKGIIHRDLKPSNVLVTFVDGVPAPKVIDFGIAKATGGSLTEQTLQTAIHQLVGTPLYMSPEQADLSGADVDTRSDIYSLGVLLYELLTGTTPFNQDALRKAAFDEVRRIIREQEPPTPSSRVRSAHQSAPDATTLADITAARRSEPARLSKLLRGELDWIVMKALEKDRTRRYETANDFADDLIRHLNNQPVEAGPPSRLYHLRKFVRRHRSRIAATLLIGALGLALAVAVVRQAARRAETASAVAQALDAAERAMRLAKWPDAMAEVKQAEALLGPGGGDDALRQRTRSLKADLAMVSRLDEIRQEMSAVRDDHFDTGLADRLYGEAFRDYGLDVEALEPDAVASKMPAGPVREELIAALDDWMRIRREMKGKDDSSWKRLLAATGAVESLSPEAVASKMPAGPVRLALTAALDTWMQIRREMDRNDDSGWKRLLAAATAADPDPWRNQVREAWVREDRKALGTLAGSAPFDRLHPCDVLLLEANLDTAAAVRVLREAQQRRPADFWLNHALGMRLHGMRPSRYDEALSYLRVALSLRPESPGAVLNIGHVLQEAERTDEAIAAYEQAIRLKPDYAMAHGNLGGALIDAGRFDEAIRACREAIRLNPSSHVAHQNLGRALMQIRELDEAIAALRKALRFWPGCPVSTRHLAEACFRRVIAGLLSIHNYIDAHVVRLRNPRPFLQCFLDPRSLSMLRRHFVLKLLAAGVLAAPVLAGGHSQYVFTSFDAPGAASTRAFGINHAGVIGGTFTDALGVGHGYVWDSGVFTQIDYPGSTGTGVGDTTGAGTIVGNYTEASGHVHGFFLSGGTYTPFDVPGSTFTRPWHSNLAGDTVGRYNDTAGKAHGFLLSSGVYTSIDYPGSIYTIACGINDNGQIDGQYQDSAGNFHGFLLSGGKFSSLDYPHSTSTVALGINNGGQIVGQYADRSGNTRGFLLSNGSYTSISYPNAILTQVFGINDLGEIVGQWTDAAGVNHGFYAVKQVVVPNRFGRIRVPSATPTDTTP
jgi:probable HAF family extracellular repeat protein